MERGFGMLPDGHDAFIAVMNPQQLRLSTLAQHKTGTVNSHSWTRERLTGPISTPPFAEFLHFNASFCTLDYLVDMTYGNPFSISILFAHPVCENYRQMSHLTCVRIDSQLT